jgi:hypothetical protein
MTTLNPIFLLKIPALAPRLGSATVAPTGRVTIFPVPHQTTRKKKPVKESEPRQIPEIGKLNLQAAPEFPACREFALQTLVFSPFVPIGVHSWFKNIFLEKRSQTLPVIIEYL